MKKKAIVFSVVVMAVAGLAVFPFASAGVESSRCPGKVVCPITGEEVCKDQCPLIDQQRADCPGKIECLLTGELVCSDECPLGESVVAEKPSCCLGSK